MSSSGSNQRFADYFVICGLDTVTGLEPDQLSGKINILKIVALFCYVIPHINCLRDILRYLHNEILILF